MSITRLRLRNFKSFGGHHDLEMSSGFTAVVGPNGSGKSNLLDALRWALGDNNPSRLRIVRQSDLIFQGSLSQHKAEEAEVELRLEEGERRVRIARRVAADGGNAVLVDGERVRLQDLDEMKRRFRMEGDRFAFIGQGEVAEILNSRPRERRMLLEALFGIDAYRKRRDEAMGRIDAAHAELVRIETLMVDLSARRDAIAPLVVSARVAYDLQEAIREKQRLLYWLRRSECERDLASTAETRRVRLSRLDRLAAWMVLWERSVADIGRRIAELEGESSGRVLLEDLRRERQGHSRNLLLAATTLREGKGRLGEVTRLLNEAEESLTKAVTEAERSAREAREAEEERRQHACRLEEMESRLFEQATAIQERRRAREQIQADIEALQIDAAGIVGRLGALGRRWRDAGRGYGAAKTALDTIETRKRLLVREVDGLRHKGADLTSRHGDALALCEGTAGELQVAKRDASKLQGTIEELRGRVQEELYPRPVQHLLSAAKLGRLDAKPVAALEAFRCPPRLAGAVEAYLGARQFWLFVENYDEAQRCIEQLKKSKGGRATFLPKEQAKPRFPVRNHHLPGGIVGWAIDLLETDDAWSACVFHLLGDLLIVEQYDTGVGIVRGGGKFPIATLDGDVFQPGGTVSGGKSDRGPGALELRRRFEEAEKALLGKEKYVKELSWSLREMEDRLNTAAQVRDEALETLHRKEEELSNLEREHTAALRRELDLRQDREEVLVALRQGGTEMREVQGRRRELECRLAEALESPEEVETGGIVAELRTALAVAVEKSRAVADMASRLDRERETALRRVDEHRSEARRIEEGLAAALSQLRHLGQQYHQVWQRERTLVAMIEKTSAAHGALSAKRTRAHRRMSVAKEHLGALRQDCERLERREGDLARELNDLTAMWEDQFPYPGPEGFAPPEDASRLRGSLRELEGRRRELGDVDLGVLSEDKSLAERIAFLEEQTGDVRTGMEQLQSFVRETDDEAGRLFSQALGSIDGQFDELFRRLFGGGEAHLSLVEGASLWEAGVELIARPPGKKPQHLAQLSGGEQSLTAIALLFAAMEVAGVPLAVLDEVDAALDEVNLRRFSSMVREYADRVQIVAMTHRRLTMERADLLYGVTMSEPGLSQVVGVRMEEWE